MKKKALYFHAGCPVCVEAETNVVDALDRERFEVEVVDLGASKDRIPEAERLGVRSVPALALDGQPFHINFGAELSQLK